MIEPTSPKKRSLMPSTPLRRKLRGLGHHLDPILQIGKDGITEGVRRQLRGALHDHELLKVRVGSECPQDRFAVADVLGAEAGVNVVQIVGRTLLLYKRHPEDPKLEGARAAARAAAPAADAKPAAKKKRAPKPGSRPKRRPRPAERTGSRRGKPPRRPRR